MIKLPFLSCLVCLSSKSFVGTCPLCDECLYTVGFLPLLPLNSVLDYLLCECLHGLCMSNIVLSRWFQYFALKFQKKSMLWVRMLKGELQRIRMWRKFLCGRPPHLSFVFKKFLDFTFQACQFISLNVVSVSALSICDSRNKGGQDTKVGNDFQSWVPASLARSWANLGTVTKPHYRFNNTKQNRKRVEQTRRHTTLAGDGDVRVRSGKDVLALALVSVTRVNFFFGWVSKVHLFWVDQLGNNSDLVWVATYHPSTTSPFESSWADRLDTT